MRLKMIKLEQAHGFGWTNSRWWQDDKLTSAIRNMNRALKRLVPR